MRPRVPVHFCWYGEGYVVTGGEWGRRSICAHHAKWPSGLARRMTVKLQNVTCEECLAVLVTYLGGKLDERLALTGGTRAAAMERAECRQAIRKLDQLVNGAA